MNPIKQIEMEYEANILIEDEQILCCSQMCNQDCSYYGKCRPVKIKIVEDFENDKIHS